MLRLVRCSLLQVGDKCRIRDRATIMSRHVYADQGDAFADQQVGFTLDRALQLHAVGSGHRYGPSLKPQVPSNAAYVGPLSCCLHVLGCLLSWLYRWATSLLPCTSTLRTCPRTWRMCMTPNGTRRGHRANSKVRWTASSGVIVFIKVL